MTFYPVDDLRDQEIFLRLDHTCTAQPEKRYLPAYYFNICLHDGTKVGHCDLRIGHNDKTYIGGNIGYGIDAPYRGHRYASKACALLFRQAEKHQMDHVIITCDPVNHASRRTLELAGGKYLETVPIPEDSEMYAEGKRRVMIWRFDFKYGEFLRAAKQIREKLQAVPLLYGSLGLERRLGVSLNADDIDVLLPCRFLTDEWQRTVTLMKDLGYSLQDEKEHAFVKGDFQMAFATAEGLEMFAGVSLKDIPLISDNGADYYLPALPQFLRVYEASSKDGYRMQVKNKQDRQKISLIMKALEAQTSID